MNQMVEKPLTPIAEYSPTAAALAELRQKYENVQFDVTTSAGMLVAVKGRAELRGYRTALEKKRVEIKAPALERARLIDAEAKRITAELLALEDPIDDLITAEQQRKEREKAEREEAERARVAGIQDRILAIAGRSAALVGKPSTVVFHEIEHLKAELSAPWAQEFQVSAEDTIARTIAALEQLHAGAVAQEEANRAEAKRIEAERAELTRLRAEQEERNRQEVARRAQQAAEEKAAREKIEAEQRASREKIEAEERAARLQREAADAAAARERAAAAAKAKSEQDAKDEADRAERAAQQAEADRLAKVQAEEAARLRAESDRLENDRREVERQQNELADGETMLKLFITRFGKRREFSAVVKAIKAHLGAP